MCDATRQAADIRTEFRLRYDPHDGWGCVIGAFFEVAETLYAWGEDVPAEWEFRPGLGEPEAAEWLDGFDADTLVDFGNVLDRWSDMLRARGDDY